MLDPIINPIFKRNDIIRTKRYRQVVKIVEIIGMKLNGTIIYRCEDLGIPQKYYIYAHKLCPPALRLRLLNIQ